MYVRRRHMERRNSPNSLAVEQYNGDRRKKIELNIAISDYRYAKKMHLAKRSPLCHHVSQHRPFELHVTSRNRRDVREQARREATSKTSIQRAKRTERRTTEETARSHGALKPRSTRLPAKDRQKHCRFGFVSRGNITSHLATLHISERTDWLDLADQSGRGPLLENLRTSMKLVII